MFVLTACSSFCFRIICYLSFWPCIINVSRHHRRAREKYFNSFPNYTLPVKDDEGNDYTIHFVALFSEKEDAIPIAFYHGWPGSFLEFLPMLEVIKKQYSAKDLPYHIIVPSLPGYTFSSGPPVHKDATSHDMPYIMNQLMIALGFSDGYIGQGGDLGSLVARQSAVRFPECKGKPRHPWAETKDTS